MTSYTIKWKKLFPIIPFLGMLFILFYYFFAQVIPKYRESFFEQKKIMLKEMVFSEWTKLEFFNKLVKDSILSIEEAKSEYIKQLSNAKPSQTKNYFWIGSINKDIIYHPHVNLRKRKKDIDNAFSEFEQSIEIALKSKEGFYEYDWFYCSDTIKKTKKVSFTKIYEPWGWFISMGLYYEDYRPLLRQSINKLLIPSVAIFLIILLILGTTFNLLRRAIIDKSLKEEKLKDTQTKYQKFIEELPIPTEIFNREGDLIQVNQAWENFWEEDSKNIKALNIFDNFPYKESIIHKKILRAFNGKPSTLSSIKVEPYVKRSYTEEKWATMKIYPVFSIHSKISNVVIQYIDITTLKKANDKLRKLSETVNQSPVSIVITDKTGKIEYVNPKFEEITGYTLKESIGKNPRILKSGEMPKEIFTDLWRTIESGRVWRGELLNKKKNGEFLWEITSIAPILDKDKAISHYVAVKEDITSRKKIEKELIKAKNKAEETDKLKSAFIANISHEIRTPLNAIVGFSSFLVEEKLDSETRKEFSEHIRINTDILTNLVDDIIDISLIEAQKIRIHKQDSKLVPILKEILSTYKEKNNRIDKKDINFNLTIEDIDEEYTIQTDANRLRQILNNLLSNALKYTNQGEITLACGKSSNSGFLLFKVEDTGIGIPEKIQEKIFEKFTHVDQEYISLHGGTGLGLSITKDLVNLLGGKIWLESSPGKPTSFFFTLPEKSDGKIEQKKKIKYYWPGNYILFIEDEETNFQHVNAQLKNTGVALIRVKNEKEALKKMYSHPKIDLILIDINTHSTFDYDSIINIKRKFPKIPIIVQTVYANEGKQKQYAQGIFSEHIAKPTNKLYLLRTIDRYFSKK